MINTTQFKKFVSINVKKTHPPAPSLGKRRGAESDIYLL